MTKEIIHSMYGTLLVLIQGPQYLCECVTALGGAFCFAGRVAEGEDDWAFVEGSHVCDDLLGEGPGNRRHTCDTQKAVNVRYDFQSSSIKSTMIFTDDGSRFQLPNHVLQLLHLRVLMSKPLLLMSQLLSTLRVGRGGGHERQESICEKGKQYQTTD